MKTGVIPTGWRRYAFHVILQSVHYGSQLGSQSLRGGHHRGRSDKQGVGWCQSRTLFSLYYNSHLTNLYHLPQVQ